MAALDLGCGTGSLSFALAAQSSPQCRIYGLDLAENQITRAQCRQKDYPNDLHFSVASMDEACFPDGTFNIIMTAMALHEATPQTRRVTIANVSRMLAPDGIFLLVDIARPRLRGWGLLLYPFVMTSASIRIAWQMPILTFALRTVFATRGWLPEFSGTQADFCKNGCTPLRLLACNLYQRKPRSHKL